MVQGYNPSKSKTTEQVVPKPKIIMKEKYEILQPKTTNSNLVEEESYQGKEFFVIE